MNECRKFIHVPCGYISALILNSRSKIETQASVNLKRKQSCMSSRTLL